MTANRSWWATAGLALALLAGGGVAQARSDVQWSIGVGVPGVVVGASSAPMYYAPPPPVYYTPPPPVYYRPPPPVYYAPPPVYYRPPPVYVVPRPHGGHHWRGGHRGWEGRRDWR